MHFLTQAWHSGDTPDEDDEAVVVAYRAHRASVLPQLPERLRIFAETVDIHDALVRRIRLDRPAATLAIDLRAGDRQMGYFDLGLRYAGVDVASLDTSILAIVAQDPRTEALYHEVDVAPDGQYEHRWLWWPYHDLDVRFREFDFQTEAQPDRAFTRDTESYEEIREAAG